MKTVTFWNLHHVMWWMITSISEEPTTSIFRVK